MIFLIPRLIAVNPIDILAASQQLPPSVVESLTLQFGLNKPLYIQYLLYLQNIVFSFPPKLGYSYVYYPITVWSLISITLPWTLFLVGSSVAISSLIGVLVGLYAGVKKGRLADKLITYFSISVESLPYFWIAIVLQMVIAVSLRLLPVGGAISITDTSKPLSIAYISDVGYHALLPMITIVAATSPVYAILMRNNVADIMNEDFMTVAEIMGLKKHRIRSYAMRNAILPLISIIAINFGYVVGGALLVEIVFDYPGVGTLLYNSILGHDYPVIQGIFYILAVTMIAANFIADIIYSYMDPRVRLQ